MHIRLDDRLTKWWQILSNHLQRPRGESRHKPFTRNLKGRTAKRRAKKKAAKRVRASLRRQRKG